MPQYLTQYIKAHTSIYCIAGKRMTQQMRGHLDAYSVESEIDSVAKFPILPPCKDFALLLSSQLYSFDYVCRKKDSSFLVSLSLDNSLGGAHIYLLIGKGPSFRNSHTGSYHYHYR